MLNGLTLTCIAPVFPTPAFPEGGAFLQNLADVMEGSGMAIQVVAPLSRGKEFRGSAPSKGPRSAVNRAYEILRPAYAELPQRLLGVNSVTRRTNDWLFRQAVERGLTACPRPVAAVYGHFWRGAYAARRWCLARNVPYFVELQESGIRDFLQPSDKPRELRVLEGAAGIVAVSKDNERFLSELGLVGKVPVRYLPNGFDARAFRPLNRADSRRALGLPMNGRVVAFVGAFIERKGPLRVLRALERLTDVKGVFLGRGPQWPRGDCVLHAGPVLNSDLPMWLAAADVFVLPSLAEGMANVTVEAMACGLPLVVSDRVFNRDFLEPDDAVFVDPQSVSSIVDGVASVLGCEKRRQTLAANALARSAGFTLQERAKRIAAFVLDATSEASMRGRLRAGHRP